MSLPAAPSPVCLSRLQNRAQMPLPGVQNSSPWGLSVFRYCSPISPLNPRPLKLLTCPGVLCLCTIFSPRLKHPSRPLPLCPPPGQHGTQAHPFSKIFSVRPSIAAQLVSPSLDAPTDSFKFSCNILFHSFARQWAL